MIARALLLGCALAACADSHHEWARTLGTSGNDRATAAAFGPDGDVFVGGYLTGPLRLADTAPAGGADAAIARLDGRGGTPIWVRRIGGPADDAITDVVTLPGGDVLAAGAFSTRLEVAGRTVESAGFADAFLLRLDGDSGAIRWVRTFGGPLGDRITALAPAAGDGVIAVGYFRDRIALAEGPWVAAGAADLFVAEIDPASGAFRWSRTFGGRGEERALDAAVGPDGRIAVAAFTDATVTLAGTTLESRGYPDPLIVVLEPDGEPVWARVHGGPHIDVARSVAVGLAGDVFVTGMSRGSLDLGGGALAHDGKLDTWVARYRGDDGAHVWSTMYGGPVGDEPHGIALAGDRVLVAGRVGRAASIGAVALRGVASADILVLSLDTATGTARSHRRYGGRRFDVPGALLFDPDLGLLLAGSTELDARFGPNAVRARGRMDMVVTRERRPP